MAFSIRMTAETKQFLFKTVSVSINNPRYFILNVQFCKINFAFWLLQQTIFPTILLQSSYFQKFFLPYDFEGALTSWKLSSLSYAIPGRKHI